MSGSENTASASADTVRSVTDSDVVTDALALWVGWGSRSWPERDPERLVEAFGQEVTSVLLPVLRQLEQDFFASAPSQGPDLWAVAEKAASRFRTLHPEIGERGVEALTWCYAFDWR